MSVPYTTYTIFMKIFQIILAILLINQSFNLKSYAQENQDTTLYRIETNDGNEFIGKITSRDGEKVILKTDNFGEITITLLSIRRIEQIDKLRMKDGEVWLDNPQATRYFWAPNGYGLKKGEAYYQNVWIFFNQVSVGVTDNFSIGGGMVPLFIFGGAPTPVYITPKFSIPVVKDKFNVGAGVLAGVVIGEEESSFGIAFGSATLGSRDKNLTVGLGYGFAGGEMSSTPVVNVSGMGRTSPRGYVLTENYLIGIDGELVGLISLGGRTIIKRISLDYGGFIPIGDIGTFIIIPWLGINVPLGKKANLH